MTWIVSLCHNDVYQRSFTPDPNNTQTVTNVLGQIKTYHVRQNRRSGNYLTEPDFAKNAGRHHARW